VALAARQSRHDGCDDPGRDPAKSRLAQPGDLGQVVDLLGGDVGLVQLHQHGAVLAVPAGPLLPRRVEGFQQAEVLAAELLQPGQLCR
jgi:hypothetical protein